MILVVVAIALFAALLLASMLCASDMRAARERVSGRSELVASPYGDIQYNSRGVGPAVLVVHGSGGGYDQGELIADALLGEGFQLITPSRFGYLRSTCPEGASFDDQAHAFAHLLDALGVQRVALVAMSHGGPSALLFAVLYPDRVSSLTLISAGVASSSSMDQSDASRRGNMLSVIFRHDPVYWLLSKLFRKSLMALMGANRSVVAGLSAEQRLQLGQVIDYMNPVSLRSAGVAFDNRATMPNQRIVAIRAPTLVVHARDDALQLYHNAEFAVANIPDSSLLSFETGGHFLMLLEQAKVRAATRAHILRYAASA